MCDKVTIPTHIPIGVKIISIKMKLVKQIYSPVRWLETVRTISKLGTHNIIECGPNKILYTLIKRISKNLEVTHLDDYDNFLEITNE